MNTQEQISKVRKIKGTYENKWLSLEGVIAVGIGNTSGGDIGIIISVKKINRRLQEEIPGEIGGVIIQLQETDEISAQ